MILWSVPRYQHWATLRGHTDLVLDLAFSPDSRTLASASGDHTIIPWTTSSAEATARIKADLDAGPD